MSDIAIVEESNIKSINIQNEKGLHSQLKEYYAKDGIMEFRCGKYIIDAMKDETLIEIQTKNFSSIKRKIFDLIEHHKLVLVYPIIEKKIIRKFDGIGNFLYERKSPKNGNYLDVFNEIMRFPEAVLNENFSVLLTKVHMLEHRTDDGKGSWRRKGISLTESELISIEEELTLETVRDFFDLVFSTDEKHIKEFTNPCEINSKELSKILNIKENLARKILYSLRIMNAIKLSGKKGNLLLYEKV